MDLNTISEGNQVFFKKGDFLKAVQIRKNRTLYMDKKKFSLAGVLGHPYGTKFQVTEGRLVKMENWLKVTEAATTSDMITTDNRDLLDKDSNQKMTRDDIMDLKEKGASADNIIEQLVENSVTFKTKTEFSQEKYIKKKKKKHLAEYRIVRPTTRLICQMYFDTKPKSICCMRMDTLSQILSYANVMSGINVMLVETCQGLLLGAIIDRLAGSGQVVQFYSGQAPPRQALEYYSFAKDYMSNVFAVPLSLVSIIDKVNDEPDELPTGNRNETPKFDQATTNKDEAKLDLQESSDSAVSKSSLRQTQREKEKHQAIQLVKAKQMDTLIVACKYDPTPIVTSLLRYVAPSRPIVIYCQYQQPLVECYMQLRYQNLGVVNLKLSETWTRNYQVLPDRTHPVVSMSAASGFLLTGTTVIQ